MLRQIFALLIAACLCQQPWAQSKLSPAARHLVAGLASGQASTRASAGATVSAYVHFVPGADASALERLGATVNLRYGDIATVRIPAGALEAAASLPGVAYVQTAVPVARMMDIVRPAVGADLVQAGSGLPRPFTGRGVVVGIIDAGFDYTHPNFRTPSGELRIRRVWEQGYGGGTPPEGFSYGSELAEPGQILAAGGDVASGSHGTHVAGIAAGSDGAGGAYLGIAPDADIVLVSISGADTETNVNISDAMAYIYRYAESVGKPCVINVSLGVQAGPHDGTSTFDTLADAMLGPGRLLVGSVGNFGGINFHLSGDFSGPGPDTLRTFVDYRQALTTATAGGDIDIWGEPGMDLKVCVFTYSTSRGEIADSFSVSLPASGQATPGVSAVLSGSVGTMAAYGETSPLNGKPHVLVTSGVSRLRAGYSVGLWVVSASEGKVDVWADGNKLGLTSGGIDGWAEGDDLNSPAEIGGTGRGVISVGAYVTRNEFDTENVGHVGTGETMGGIASFSSHGPTADGRVKPDVAAPGSAVVSSASSHDATLSSQPVALYQQYGGLDYAYAYMQGTSMAAPVVTGTVAQWLEACPGLSPADVRRIIASTSVSDSYTGDVGPGGDCTWGFGKLDAMAGMQAVLDFASGLPGVAAVPSTVAVCPLGGGRVRIVAPAGSAVSVAVSRADGVSVMSADGVSPGHVADLSALSSGVYVVRASAAAGTACAKVAVR